MPSPGRPSWMTAFHWAKRADGASTRLPDFGVGTEPAGPFPAGIFGVAGAYKKFQAGFAGRAGGFCAGGRRRTPPLDAAPLREQLRVEGARFEGAFGLDIQGRRRRLFRDWRCKEKFCRGVAGDAGDLRGAGFGEVREDAVAIDREKRAVVAGSGQEAAFGSEAESVDDIIAGGPKFFGRAIGEMR